jgi:hypothetical protein
MSKFVKSLFLTIVAIYCGVLAYDRYAGYTGGAILMFIGVCGVGGIRWAGEWALHYDARMARLEQGTDTST